MTDQAIAAPRDRKEDLYTAKPWQLIWRRGSKLLLAVIWLGFLGLLGLAGLFAEGETEIRGAECAAVSFPGFFDVLSSVTNG